MKHGRKKMMGGGYKKKMMGYSMGGKVDGNKAARREYMKGGQVHYAHGEMPKAKAN